MAILAYWQVAFNKYILTHDFVNCWLPWRYYLSQCIHNGIFPYWNPYQQLGYPIHADLQGPIWYFESWIISMITEQNPVTLQYLFVSYIALAGIGMYGLSFYLSESKKAAFVVGITYMLSGFFVSHSQHFFSVISAAWLPFIFLNFLKLLHRKQLKYGIYTSIFLFFTLTGGNHTFAFFTAYLLTTIASIYLIKSLKSNQAEFWLHVRQISLTLLFSIAQVTMVIVVFLQVQPYIGRLSGLDYEACIANSFTWKAAISFFQPFATTVEWSFYDTDPSMSNHYFGIFMLPISILFAFKKKSTLEITLFIFAVVCLILSFGDATPLYKWFHQFLPGINLFRFISYFAFMFTFCMLLLLGNTLSYYQFNNINKNNKLLRMVFVGFITLILFIFIYSLSKGNFSNFITYFFNNDLFSRTSYGNKYDHIAFQSMIQLLLFLLLMMVYQVRKNYLSIALIFVMTIDVVLAVQLNIGNVCVGNLNPKELNNYLLTLPKKFDCPPDEPLANFNEERGQKHGLFRNTATYNHWISDSYHNSFVFAGKTYLYFDKPKMHEAILKNNLFYLSNEIFPFRKIDEVLKMENLKKKVLFDEKDYNILSNKVAINDTMVQGSVKLLDLKPNFLKASISCQANTLLHCIQSYYTGWKAFVDGTETPIYRSNGLTMSLLVPKGDHIVSFQYSNPTSIMAGAFSYGVFLILLIYASFINRKHPIFRYIFIGFWTIGIFIILRHFLTLYF